MTTTLQDLCEIGQQQLGRMNYLEAEEALAAAERDAYAVKDFDTLARLYMPLQEARRQRRLRCGEGTVCLDLIADGPDDQMQGRHVVENYPHGQLLVAGWGTIAPAVEVRKLQAAHKLYVETFLGAVYPAGDRWVVVIVPADGVRLPAPQPRSREELARLLPARCLIHEIDELPRGNQRGTSQTFGRVMAMWERLHRPFLAAADAQAEALAKIDGYRGTIEVDYACELAHQKLSDVARALPRRASTG